MFLVYVLTALITVFGLVASLVTAFQFTIDPQFKATFLVQLIANPLFNLILSVDCFINTLHGRVVLASTRKLFQALVQSCVELLFYTFSKSFKWNYPTMVGYIVANVLSLVWALMIRFNKSVMKVELQEFGEEYQPNTLINQFKELPKFWKDRGFVFNLFRWLLSLSVFVMLPCMVLVKAKSALTPADQASLFVYYNVGSMMFLIPRVYFDSLLTVIDELLL